jgi:hypothetical protein
MSQSLQTENTSHIPNYLTTDREIETTGSNFRDYLFGGYPTSGSEIASKGKVFRGVHLSKITNRTAYIWGLYGTCLFS